MNEPKLLEVRRLRKYFPVTKGVILRKSLGFVKAVEEVSFSIRKGETFGLVGESGSGKTTIAMMILRLIYPTAGSIIFDGKNVTNLREKDINFFRRRVSAVFQDPFSSLDPRLNASSIISEPMEINKIGDKTYRRSRVRELLKRVGLLPEDGGKYPHQFSGGQRQRLAIARALSVQPDLIVADEPVSSLDVSIQAKIINLMKDLQQELGISYIFIGHDLSVVKQISHTIGVMYLGRLVELGPSNKLFRNPLHPYTTALIQSVPTPDPEQARNKNLAVLNGEIPSPMNPPEGCLFHTRCSYAKEDCTKNIPILETAGNRLVACHYWRGLAANNV